MTTQNWQPLGGFSWTRQPSPLVHLVEVLAARSDGAVGAGLCTRDVSERESGGVDRPDGDSASRIFGWSVSGPIYGRTVMAWLLGAVSDQWILDSVFDATR